MRFYAIGLELLDTAPYVFQQSDGVSFSRRRAGRQSSSAVRDERRCDFRTAAVTGSSPVVNSQPSKPHGRVTLGISKAEIVRLGLK